MRGIWVALTLLVALSGGGVSGYYANLMYGPRSSLYPLRVGTPSPFSISVRRITYVKAAEDKNEPRMSTPGIVDITPPEAMAALGQPSATVVTQNTNPSENSAVVSQGSTEDEEKLGLR